MADIETVVISSSSSKNSVVEPTNTPTRIGSSSQKKGKNSSAGSSRNHSNSKKASSSKNPSEFLFKNPPNHPDPDADMRKEVEKYESIHAGFVVKMKATFVAGDCRLNVPRDHGSAYLKHLKDNDIKLSVGTMSWNVTVKTSRDEYRLGKGWRVFVHDNGIAMNDICVFKMRKVGVYRELLEGVCRAGSNSRRRCHAVFPM